MSFEKAKKDLTMLGYDDRIIELDESSATVPLAAKALGVEPGMIAKTMSFLIDDSPILILTEGTARIDNRKFKNTFHVKAKMIPADLVESKIGHAPGGVCPFGIHDGIPVYLDESLRRFDTVYPAAGNDHSAVKLTIPELEETSRMTDWVNVCKETVPADATTNQEDQKADTGKQNAPASDSDSQKDPGLDGNEAIEDAVLALQQEASPELLAHALTVIRRRMQQNGEFIIAVNPPAAGAAMELQTVKTGDGSDWWIAFTGFEEELKGSGSVMSTFLTNIRKLFEMVLQTPDIHGVILNPWNRTLMLDKHLIEIILGKQN